MKKYVFTKNFIDNEIETFINEYVGDDKYYKIRPQWITVDNGTMTIAMKYSSNFHCRKKLLEENGFTWERKEF